MSDSWFWTGLAVGLAMDSAAAGLAAGAARCGLPLVRALRFAAACGLAQGGVFWIGTRLGGSTLSHGPAATIAAGLLLAGVGGHMFWEARRRGATTRIVDPTRGWALTAVALATSVDAGVAGIGCALVGRDSAVGALWIGWVTLLLAFGGIRLGCRLGRAAGRYCGLVGGGILVALAVRTLLGA